MHDWEMYNITDILPAVKYAYVDITQDMIF